MRITRWALVGLALLGHGTVRAGEELMPMRGNAYSEVSAPVTVSAVRKATSLDPAPKRHSQPKPQTHRNMVRVTLPSLGAKSESPPRLIEMDGQNLDGSLNFSLVRPAPAASEAGIPGLIMPEELALDKYRLADPEPEPPAFVFPDPAVSRPAPAAAGERALDGLVPLGDMPRPASSPSFPPLDLPRKAPQSFAAGPAPQALPSVQVPPVMEIPQVADLTNSEPPARPVARAATQPLRIDLSPRPVQSAQSPQSAQPGSEADFAAPSRVALNGDEGTGPSLRPPSAMRPAPEQPARRHQPQAVETPAVRVPGLGLEEINVPGAGAMLPADMPYYPMPEPVPAALLDDGGATVETLREVLRPIYRAGE